MNIFNLNLPKIKSEQSGIYKILEEAKKDFIKDTGGGYDSFLPYIYRSNSYDYLVVLFPINNDEWSEVAFKLCHKLASLKEISVTHDRRLLEFARKDWQSRSSIDAFIPALFYI